MDTSQTDEHVILTNDPLDVVEHVLTAENLPFDRTEEGDLAFTLAGDWKDYELWFAWRPEGDTLQLCLSMDLGGRSPSARRRRKLIATINPRVWLGHFELWDEGEIIFRHGMALMTNEQPSLARQAAAMIDVAVEAADRFFPASSTSCSAAPRPRRRRSPPACSRPSARPRGIFNTAHPGECREPELKTGTRIEALSALGTRFQRQAIWIPASPG